MIIQGMFLPESSCESFRRNPDGSWECIKPVTIFGYGGLIEISQGMLFTPGVPFTGIDMVAWLEENCGQ
jgi:hypothetical protein